MKKEDRKKFIIFTAICILLFFIFIAAVYLFISGFSLGNKSAPPADKPSGPNEDYNKEFNSNIDIEKEASEKIDVVQSLRNKLPYEGNNFSLSYDFDSNTYTAIINKANESLGNQELDSYLKVNGIEDRSWMPDLVIVVN